MYRGTTPTLNFTLPFSVDLIEALSVAFAQNNELVFDKSIEDDGCTLEEKNITIKLTQEDTLKLSAKKNTEIQIRIRTIDGEALASKIITVCTQRILRDGEI